MKLEDLGITKEELSARLVDDLVERIITDGNFPTDEDAFLATVKERVEDYVRAKVDAIMGDFLGKRLEEMILNMTFGKTNGWGEYQTERKTFKEFIVSVAEVWLHEKVDRDGLSAQEYIGKNGNSSSYRWVERGPRLRTMVEHCIQGQVTGALNPIMAGFHEALAGGIAGEVKRVLAETLKRIVVESKVV